MNHIFCHLIMKAVGAFVLSKLIKRLSLFCTWSKILGASMSTNIWPSLAMAKCRVPPSYPGSPDLSMLVQWSLTGYEHSTWLVCTHRISTVSTPPCPATPLRCSTRIFTMYNAHIPKAWRVYTDFHTYSLTLHSRKKVGSWDPGSKLFFQPKLGKLRPD